MSAPAYRLISTAAAAGRFGLDAFGTSPFGGNRPAAFELPPLRNDSDIPERDFRRVASDVVIERDGVPLSVRVRGEFRPLRHQFRGLSYEQVLQLRAFWQARLFEYLPGGPEGGTVWNVYWRGDYDTNVTRRRDGLYNVDANLMEVWS